MKIQKMMSYDVTSFHLNASNYFVRPIRDSVTTAIVYIKKAGLLWLKLWRKHAESTLGTPQIVPMVLDATLARSTNFGQYAVVS